MGTPIAKFEVTVYSDGDFFVRPFKKGKPKPVRFEELQREIRRQLREYSDMVVAIEVRKSKTKK